MVLLVRHYRAREAHKIFRPWALAVNFSIVRPRRRRDVVRIRPPVVARGHPPRTRSPTSTVGNSIPTEGLGSIPIGRVLRSSGDDVPDRVEAAASADVLLLLSSGGGRSCRNTADRGPCCCCRSSSSPVPPSARVRALHKGFLRRVSRATSLSRSRSLLLSRSQIGPQRPRLLGPAPATLRPPLTAAAAAAARIVEQRPTTMPGRRRRAR